MCDISIPVKHHIKTTFFNFGESISRRFFAPLQLANMFTHCKNRIKFVMAVTTNATVMLLAVSASQW